MNSASLYRAASARMAVTMRIARLVRSAVIELFHVRLLSFGPSVRLRAGPLFLETLMNTITIVAIACAYVAVIVFALAIVGGNGRDLDE